MQSCNKYLNVRERGEVVERNKTWSPTLPLLSFESSVSVKENPDKKIVASKSQSSVITLQLGNL